MLAALFAALPFIAANNIGILGVGLVNDDMASHLLLADWIREGFRPEPVLVDQGYPLGPHALVAGIGALLGASSIDVFAGLTLAIPALTALLAYSALDGLRAVPRVGAAALVALPYMAAAYLAQEAFKEPIIALFVLSWALLLPAVRGWRDAIPLGLLAAGTVYVYSFPGLAWLAGVAVVWGVIELVRGARPGRSAWSIAAVGALVLALLALADLDRLRDFADFRALHPDRANEGGLGNLPGQLSPLEALGIWPTSEFRLSAAASSSPAVVFYAGGLLAAVALALGLPRWLRRHGSAVPAALLAAALLYLAARAFGTVYTSAKALAIAAPLIALIALGGLLLPERRRWPLALGAVFAAAAAFSSFLVLRQAPVGPEAHAAELAEIRPLVEGEKLLFLGRDNFVLHELRGSKPFTHVRNFYDPYFVEPNFELEDVGAKFDFDSVGAADPGPVPLRADDARRLRQRRATRLPARARDRQLSALAPRPRRPRPATRGDRRAAGSARRLRKGPRAGSSASARRRASLRDWSRGDDRGRWLGDDDDRAPAGELGALAAVRREPPADRRAPRARRRPCPPTSTIAAPRRSGPRGRSRSTRAVRSPSPPRSSARRWRAGCSAPTRSPTWVRLRRPSPGRRPREAAAATSTGTGDSVG